MVARVTTLNSWDAIANTASPTVTSRARRRRRRLSEADTSAARHTTTASAVNAIDTASTVSGSAPSRYHGAGWSAAASVHVSRTSSRKTRPSTDSNP